MTGKQRRKKGFSLIEMLVVLAIMGILAGFAGMKVVQNIAKAKITRAKSQIAVFGKAIEQYRIDTNIFPEYLDDLVTQPTDVEGWSGPYMEAIPLDSWGNEYVYFPPEPGSTEFLIISYGADGVEDGEGENADISNLTLIETAEH